MIRRFTRTGGIDWRTGKPALDGFWRVDGYQIELLGLRVVWVHRATHNTPKETKRKISIQQIG
jgi:hypothetical protein